MWYSDGSADLAVEIEQPLHAYLDVSQARTIAVMPLRAADTETAHHSAPIEGVLVAEQFQTAVDDGVFRERVAAVADHSAMALANAISVTRQPLAPLNRVLSRVRWLVEARQLPKTLLVLTAAAGVVAALAFVPADFDIEARGELQPKSRRDVFATDDGVVSELLVDHAQAVRAGEPLLRLRKPELDLESRRVVGEMQTAEKKLASLRAERLRKCLRPAGARRDPQQLAADEEELKDTLDRSARSKRFSSEHRDELIDSQPHRWAGHDLEHRATARRSPGRTRTGAADRGRSVGPWVLELHVADDRAGHVLAARERLPTGLDVTLCCFRSGHEYHGRVTRSRRRPSSTTTAEPTVLRDGRVRQRTTCRHWAGSHGHGQDSLRPALAGLCVAARPVRIRSLLWW